MKKWTKGTIVFWSAVLLGAVVAFEFHWMLHRKREAHMGEAIVRNPPWLMWGNTQTLRLEVNPSAGVIRNLVSGQLVRINYKRPENWRFLFVAEVIESDITGTAPVPVHIGVGFDVVTGVGRSSVTIKNFEAFGWDALVVNTLRNQPHFSTSVDGHARNPGSTTVNIIDVLPGQDIQVNTNVVVALATGGSYVTVAVTAYFCPNVHIRPEWFKGKMGYEEDEGH